MNRFGDDDRIFRLFCMNPDLETGPQSAIPTVAAMDDATLRATIANNMTRARYLGIDPTTTALTAPGRYAKGKWRCSVAAEPSQGMRLSVLAEDYDVDETFMVFADDLLLHIVKPHGGRIFSIKYDQALASETRVTIVGRSGVLVNEASGDFWSPDPPSTGHHNVTDLRAAAEAGFFLNKKGRLKTLKYGIESAKERLANFYTSVNSCLEEEFNYSIYASHGTLLGLVREGDLIAYDDDFDCAYVSRFQDCAKVADERYQIIECLTASGIRSNFGKTGHIKVKGKGASIDLMPAWFDDETYNVSGFTAVPLPQSSVLPLQRFSFHGSEVYIPARPEEFLALNYGSGWRTPDPYYRSEPPHKAKRHRKIFQTARSPD